MSLWGGEVEVAGKVYAALMGPYLEMARVYVIFLTRIPRTENFTIAGAPLLLDRQARVTVGSDAIELNDYVAALRGDAATCRTSA